MTRYDRIKHYYDNFGRIYDTQRSSPYFTIIKEIELSILLPHVRGKKVLEIGCGTGLILQEVHKIAHEAWGIDISEGMLSEAKLKGLKVKHDNATGINFPNSSFDIIYSFKVLPHVLEVEKVIEETHRLLKKDGMCILEFYNPFSIKYITNFFTNYKRNVYIRYDNLSRIKRLLNNQFYIEAVNGIRTIIPTALVVRKGFSAKMFSCIEKFCSKSNLSLFSSYLVITAKKQ
jgi:ubiquinone/menaquinone biosynthesis C-methylase UbiE